MPLFFYANLMPIVVSGAIFVVALAIWRVYRSRDDGAPMRWGALLVGTGLAAFLFGRIKSQLISADQAETLRNFFIIIAGIGANMLAGAAMVNVDKARANGAMFRRYPGKIVFSQAIIGWLVVLTFEPPPERDKAVDQQGEREPDGKVPPVKN